MNPIFPELPTKLGIYSLTQLLCVRERSELYLATQSYVDRAVVIEVLRPGVEVDSQAVFRETARLRAAANLPHVAPVLESASTGTLHYLIQEEPTGEPLQHMEQKLSEEQAFSLIQSVAEVYCACAELGMAARPILVQDVYTDGDAFYFFSPVVSGTPSDALRAEQMDALAVILEQVLDEKSFASNNISIIINWLQQGYGSTPMQWQPLAASLSTLRAARERDKGGKFKERLQTLMSSKHAQKMALRSVKRYAILLLVLLCLVAGVASVGFFFEEEVHEDHEALYGRYLHCGTEKNMWRVLAQPVSVEDYGDFLGAWDRMSIKERNALCEGLPESEATANREPLRWSEQQTAAMARREWMGFKMNMHAPVRGVSYSDALIYARYAKSELPGVELVRTARLHAGEPMVEEWTSLQYPATLPYDTSYVVYPEYGSNLISEPEIGNRNLKRGFRICNKTKPQS